MRCHLGPSEVRLIKILLSSNSVSCCKYARLHSMKLGSCSKINQETVSDYLWAGGTATGKSKIRSLPQGRVSSTSVAYCVCDGVAGRGVVFFVGGGDCAGPCRTLSSILWPLFTWRQKQYTHTHTHTHTHTVTTKYVSRCCQRPPGPQIPPL